MKSIISTLPLFAAAFAAPSRRALHDVDITLINKISDGSALGSVPSGNSPFLFTGIFPASPRMLQQGSLSASSVTLRKPTIDGKRVECKITVGDKVVYLTTENPLVDFSSIIVVNNDGSESTTLDAGKGSVNLSEETISCGVEGAGGVVERRHSTPKTKRSVYDLNLTVYNDRTGANFVGPITSGNYPNPLTVSFLQSPLANNGRIFATSVQFSGISGGGEGKGYREIRCTFKLGTQEVKFGSLSTWAKVVPEGQTEAVDVTDATVACGGQDDNGGFTD